MPIDINKIKFYISFFNMRPEREWFRSKEDRGVGNIMWEDFKIILLNNITNAPNRRLDVANKYKVAK